MTSNDRGVDVEAAANLIFRNSARNNGINFDVAADNVFGTVVDRTAPGSGGFSGNSAASSEGTTDPWANFGY